jgi:peptidylprolyl isomerase
MKRPLFALLSLSVITFAGALAVHAEPTTQPEAKKTVTESGLTIIDLGRDETSAREGDFVTVHYTGKLEDGTVFDSSRNAGRSPFSLQVGVTAVIKGWQEGLVGMRVGDRRQLIIPADLGYGARGAPPSIPPNATLVFDVEMLSISRPAVTPNP